MSRPDRNVAARLHVAPALDAHATLPEACVMRSRTSPRLQGFDYRTQRTYFVTFCTRQRLKSLADESVAKTCAGRVLHFREYGWYWLYAHCIMPDHIHLVLKTRQAARDLQTIVATLKRAIAFECAQNGVTVR